MPEAEAAALIIVTIAFFAGSWGIVDSVLKHRRKMFEMKQERGAMDVKDAQDKALAHDNTELRETITLMQDRIAVLEQIATDPARRTADEIEKLR